MELIINIKGTIDTMQVGESFSLPADRYKAGSARNLAARAGITTGRRYKVSKRNEVITISRIA